MITSLQNPLIKKTTKLWQRRARDKTSRFLVEGFRELTRMGLSQIPCETLFFCPALFLGDNEPRLISAYKKRGATVVECSEKVFRHLSYRDRPDGLLAVAHQIKLPLEGLHINENPFLVVAESIEKPGNLGTILRSADAAGADGLILADKCTDLFNPNVVRASVGTLFTVSLAEASTANTLSFLKRKGIAIVAATPSAKKNFTEVNLTGPVAILVGSEQYGLTNTMLEKADIRVKIPMLGEADSLNVATATTLLLYEVVRQRAIS